MTRAERKARNKAAHAIRRVLTDADYREARADDLELSWRTIADTYASMSTEQILAEFGDVVTSPATPVAVPKPVRAPRKAPAHVAAASEEFRLAREAWESGLADAMRGARSNGRPARGERYCDEERDYRDAHPAPVFKEFLAATYAAMKAAADTGVTA